MKEICFTYLQTGVQLPETEEGDMGNLLTKCWVEMTRMGSSGVLDASLQDEVVKSRMK